MFDITNIEKEARAELAEELGKSAKQKIKAKLREINMAERALTNMRQEYQVLLRDIGSEADAA
jgi:hypothetical protein